MTIRPANEQDIPGIARVHVASWLASFRVINQRTDTHWYSRRHKDVTRAVKDVAILSTQGIAFLAPDLQLLYKAKQCHWLAEQLPRFHPDGPWIAAIERSYGA